MRGRNKPRKNKKEEVVMIRTVIIALILIASLLCACSASATPAISAAPPNTSSGISVIQNVATQQPAFKPSNPAAEDISILPTDRWCLLSPCETEIINKTSWTSFGQGILLKSSLQPGDVGILTVKIKGKEYNAGAKIIKPIYNGNKCWASVLFDAACLPQQKDPGIMACFKK